MQENPNQARSSSQRSTIRRVSGKDAIAIPSIADALKNDAEPEGKNEQVKNAGNAGKMAPRQVHPFTQDKLVAIWKDFVDKVEAPQLKSALSTREPLLKSEWIVEYELDNELQNQRIMLELKPKLLGHLRQSLGNEIIEIEFIISRHSDYKPTVPYTESEKWQALIEKYPALITLKNKFGLDFE